jgi:hypothetical protein
MLLACKLFLAPLMISLATLAGRRYGVVVSGFLVGLPLTSGPISFLLGYEYGLEFGAHTAVGSLAGQISNCCFCLVYAWVSRRLGWRSSVAAAIAAFLVSTAVLNGVSWTLWPAFLTLLLAIGVATVLIPNSSNESPVASPPAWDLPARIATAAILVLALTAAADALGPQLSGLIAPFPAFIIIFAIFTHSRQGTRAVTNLLRGIVVASPAFAVFFLVVSSMLTGWGLLPTYLAATVLAVATSGLSFELSRRFARRNA